MDYTLIRSKRKTISLQVSEKGVIVRAPSRTTKREADEFVKKHEDWINKQLMKVDRRKAAAENVGKLSPEELMALARKAADYIPGRVNYYADMLGESYGRVTIRCQRTRWGSCSTKRNLNFNCLLMLTAPDIIDSVVVHEVCHLREMNHSKRFYELVLGLYPDYYRCDKWLKDNGRTLLARVPEDQR